MIGSVLAGYAWDEANPFVAASERRLTRLAEACQGSATAFTHSDQHDARP